MRFLFRLAVLGLAAVGAKSLYEKLAPKKDAFRDAGSDFVNRAGTAAQEVGAKVQGATQRVMSTAQQSAAEVTSTAKAQAGEVKAAAEDAMDKSRSGDTASPAPPAASQSAPSHP